MSAVFTQSVTGGPLLPLLGAARADATVAFGPGGAIDAAHFLADVRAVAAGLPEGGFAVNLCEDRYHFLVAFCAVALRGQVNLLPHSRAAHVVSETLSLYPGSYSIIDTLPACDTLPVPPRVHRIECGAQASDAGALDVPGLGAKQCVAIGFTSGSTGQPKPNAKSWGGFSASNARNLQLVRTLLAEGGFHADTPASIIATVPPQHMYGMETSVLLPLLGALPVHSARPFFPADVAQALADAPAPRLLVTTPVHLRALLRSDVDFPPIAGVVSATAPLPVDLAAAAEARLGAPVQELFGSTETCVIAHRRTATEADWELYEGVTLAPQPDGSLVEAPWLEQPVALQDIVELLPDRRFRLQGRNADLLEIAGKRASLADLTRRVLALQGVEDAVVFQPDAGEGGGVRRVAALVVAPGRDEAGLLAELKAALDPVFLPRPLKCVARLPRNDTGKLPRAALIAALSGD